MEIFTWITQNWSRIAELIAAIIGVASIIVKMTPTLRDDNILLGVVKFLGKYVALNKTVTDADRAALK
jgi:hypothetical protein